MILNIQDFFNDKNNVILICVLAVVVLVALIWFLIGIFLSKRPKKAKYDEELDSLDVNLGSLKDLELSKSDSEFEKNTSDNQNSGDSATVFEQEPTTEDDSVKFEEVEETDAPTYTEDVSKSNVTQNGVPISS